MKSKFCPFCGEVPTVYPIEFDEITDNTWGQVSCVNEDCVCHPTVFDGVEHDEAIGNPYYKQAAIDRWNNALITFAPNLV